jgi:hypothetical protein
MATSASMGTVDVEFDRPELAGGTGTVAVQLAGLWQEGQGVVLGE